MSSSSETEKCSKKRKPTLENHTENHLSSEELINNLNDHCFIHIFQYLSVAEKLKIEEVCTKWQRVGKLCWFDSKSLELSDELETELQVFKCKKEKSNYLLNITKRCAPYLNNVCIEKDLDLYCYEIFEEIFLNCKNLTVLKLNLCLITNTTIYEKDVLKNLTELFKNNPNISTIALRSIDFDCECLESLTAINIKEFYLDCSIMMYKEDFFNFVKKLRNLEIFHVNISDVDLIVLLDALNMSGNENLIDINLYSAEDNGISGIVRKFYNLPIGNPNDTNFNYEVFYKQRRLSKLSIMDLYFDRDFYENLPNPDLIEKLGVKFNEASLHGLRRFQNLKCFEGTVYNLTDRCIRNLTRCTDLRDIHIELFTNNENPSLLSADFNNNYSRNYFAVFINLKSFKLSTFTNKEDDTLYKDYIRNNNFNRNREIANIRPRFQENMFNLNIQNQLENFEPLHIVEQILIELNQERNRNNNINLARCLSACNNITNLTLRNYTFEPECMNYIVLLRNIEILDFSFSNIINKDISHAVINLLNLKKINIFPFMLSSNYLTELSNIKVDRGDENYLEIYCKKYLPVYRKNNFPLLIVIE